MTDAAAGMRADAVRKGLTDSIRKGSDAEARGRQILAQTIADLTEQGAKEVDQMEARVTIQQKVNNAVASGAMNTEQARQAAQTEIALRPLLIAQALAEDKAKEGLTETIQRLTAAYANDNGEQKRSVAQQMVEDQKLSVGYLEQEVALQGETQVQREQNLAVLQAKTDLLRQHIELAGAEGQEYVANAKKAAMLNQQLDLISASRGELEGAFDTLAGDIETFRRNGKFAWSDWGDFALQTIDDVEVELFKLSTINPIKNALFGTNSPTLDSVGGLLGGLLNGGGLDSAVKSAIAANPQLFHTGGVAGLGGGASREVPASIMAQAPRFHSGAYLAPDEVPAILQTGERVLNRQEAKEYNRDMSAAPARIEVVFTASNEGGAEAATSAKVISSGGLDLIAMVDNATARNLGNWFRTVCDQAGLPRGCAAHGLRKAASRRLAEAGCTAHQIMAITGHRTLREVTRYTETVDRAAAAVAAMEKLGKRTTSVKP